MVQRITQGVWYGLGPSQKLLEGIGITSAEVLRYTIGAHCPPLVVVALKPNLSQISKTTVLGQVFRGKMAVIVEDRLPGRVLFV
jgi:hypothetical protein